MNEPILRDFQGSLIKIICKPGVETGKAFRTGYNYFVDEQTFTRLRTQPTDHMELLGSRIHIVDIESESELRTQSNTASEKGNDNHVLFGFFFAVVLLALIPVVLFIDCRDAVRASEPVRRAAEEPNTAYYRAVDYAKAKYPGARSVSDKSKIEKLGEGHYVVGIVVDGLNSFGGPVRSLIAVEVKLSGGKWEMISIASQPFGESLPVN